MLKCLFLAEEAFLLYSSLSTLKTATKIHVGQLQSFLVDTVYVSPYQTQTEPLIVVSIST